MKNSDGWQSLAVLICLLSQGWRQLLVCKCFPGGPYRLKSNREGGKLRTCFDLPSKIFVSQGSWRWPATSWSIRPHWERTMILLAFTPLWSLKEESVNRCLCPGCYGSPCCLKQLCSLPFLHASFLGCDPVNAGGLSTRCCTYPQSTHNSFSVGRKSWCKPYPCISCPCSHCQQPYW